jgi:hypothetical protein
MGLLRMFSRAAFICNICFLLAVGVLMHKNLVSPELSSPILVMGFFLSVFLNLLVNIWLLTRRVQKKPSAALPDFLIYANACFLVIQLILLFK